MCHSVKLLTLVISLAIAGSVSHAGAQSGALPDAPQPVAPPVTVHDAPRNVLRDQAAIWTSPLHIRTHNAAGPIVLVLATTVAITADHQAMTSVVSHDATLNNHADQASQALVGTLVAAPAALFVVGRLHHNEHATETGILSAESVVDSLAVGEAGKLITWRERPDVDGARGRWFQSGTGINSSFPSEHALVAWSAASTIAHEYPGFWTDTAVYTLAGGVSIARVMARRHFPSDVLVGSALGWMIGRYVVHRRRHYHPE